MNAPSDEPRGAAEGRVGTAAAPARGPFLGGWYPLAAIVLLAASIGLWAPDEPRYAEVAREAWDGDLLVMHLNGDVYFAKPPLVYWLAGAFGRCFGWHELALRLPSLLATLATAWLAARLARRYWGELEARWTVFFALGSAMVFYIGGRVQLDPVLSALCLAAVERATVEDGTRAERGRARLVGGLCAGLAALAKGPVAWLHVGVGVIALHLARERARDAAAPRKGSWFAFALLALVPVVAWGLAASFAEHARTGTWDLFRSLFFGQHFGRVIEGTEHRGPPWEFLATFPPLFLPFTPFLLVGLVRAWRVRRALGARASVESARSELVRGERALVGFALAFTVLFVAFSAMPPKRDLYLLPLYPAAALLCARVVAETLRGAPLARGFGLVSALVWTLVGAAGLVGLVAVLGVVRIEALDALARKPDAEDVLEVVRANVPGVAAVFGAFLLGGAAALFAFARRRVAFGLDALGVGITVAVAAAALFVLPAIDPLKCARGLAEELAARPEKPTRIACVGVQPEGYRFYGRVPAVKEDLEVALAREGDRFLALVARKNFELLPETLRARLSVLASRSVGSRDVLVLGAAR